jgi:hypothetical protein
MGKKSEQPSTTPPTTSESNDDPVGCCMFTNASGQRVCLDNVKKSECDQIQNSIFIEGGTCD